MRMRNLAGTEVAIFLFRFDLKNNGIDFVLNEMIAEDMYPDIDKRLQPLIQVCSETLLRYKHLSVTPTIMDGTIHYDGGFEVMLSKGLGKHFMAQEKERLFEDARRIAELLQIVMERRSKEARGEKSARDFTETFDHFDDLEKMLLQIDSMQPIKPGLKQCRPEDLPPGVTTSLGQDHRGHCYVFEHEVLGPLGKIILVPQEDDKTLLQAELFQGGENLKSPKIKHERQQTFEEIVAVIEERMQENFES